MTMSLYSHVLEGRGCAVAETKYTMGEGVFALPHVLGRKQIDVLLSSREE